MKFSICSFSFHRGFFDGSVDPFRYISLSRELGATDLHFWLPHLLRKPDLSIIRGWDWSPGPAGIPPWMEAPSDRVWAEELRAAIAASGLGLEMLAMEKGYAHHHDPEVLRRHRQFVRPWMEFASWVGLPALRVDPGVPRGADESQLRAAAAGYRDLLRMGQDYGVSVYVENHWGASQEPAFLVRLLDEVPELGYLFDTANFSDVAGARDAAWSQMIPRAKAVHIKTHRVDVEGRDHDYPVHQAVQRLVRSGFAGIWGIEGFCPPEWCGEVEAVRRTMSLIRRVVLAESGQPMRTETAPPGSRVGLNP